MALLERQDGGLKQESEAEVWVLGCGGKEATSESLLGCAYLDTAGFWAKCLNQHI